MSDSQLLGDGDAVVLVVKGAPLVWRGVAAVMLAGGTAHYLSLTMAEFSSGTHYWEMKLLKDKMNP
jgi:hypothetical protein